MSFIDRMLKNLAWIGEMSSYGIIQNEEETSEEFHITEDQLQSSAQKEGFLKDAN
ncbi:hypothetical protein [Ureibacillus acetophenoni]|uniref:Uncharacterized protein n=1 Tax=Ureibacillus acetophenoni TaxID=614649 RepID=A0A285U590_9BACL|nr:hypothetical protein [Ureibacillus acetophenoni]SOC37110.1 hypothetical protein SAMN05877842_10341 [Ureibacillus acetophenoni]